MQFNFSEQRRSANRMLLLFGSMALLGTIALLPGCQKEVSPKQPALEAKSAHLSKSLKSVDLEVVAEGLTSPLGLTEVPDGSGRKFIHDQIGVVRIVDA